MKGLEEPQSTNQARGTKIHQEIEFYIKHKREPETPAARNAMDLVDSYRPRIIGVERPLGDGVLSACGIPFAGYIDLLLSADESLHIIDWKTTGNLKNVRFKGPTTQQLGYAEHFYRQYPDLHDKEIVSSYIYLEASEEPPPPLVKSVALNRKSCADGWTGVEGVVTEMIEVARASDVNSVPFNLKACRVGPNVCAFAGVCPKGGVDLMGVFDDFLGAAEEKKEDTKSTVVDELTQLAQKNGEYNITPPDMPVAAAIQADLKVESEAPKKRGRPPGVKNKPRAMEIKDVSATPDQPVSTTAAPEDQKPGDTIVINPLANIEAPGFQTKVIVRHGLTINMGNYQSARVEVELEALIGTDDPEEARRRLGEAARRALEEECKPYRALLEKKEEKK